MKLTKSKLKQLIKEELQNVILEQSKSYQRCDKEGGPGGVVLTNSDWHKKYLKMGAKCHGPVNKSGGPVRKSVPWEYVRRRLKVLNEEVFEPLNKLLKLGIPIEKFGRMEKYELDQIVGSLQFNMKHLLRDLPRGR